MRNDGYIERFNELAAAIRYQRDFAASRDAFQRTSGSSSVSKLWYLVSLAFTEHQTWFKVSPRNNRILYFPFARYLEKGMEIVNRTRNARYIVDHVNLEQSYTTPFGEEVKIPAVYISSGTPPIETDRLRFTDDKYIQLRPARARSWAPNVNFNTEQREDYGAWNDTITYYLTRREAGSIATAPFGRHRERKPRFRSSETDDSIDATAELSTFGQCFDNLCQFDCWAKEATEADKLADYFERFLTMWSCVISYNGIEKIWYWGRGMDAVESKWRNDITVRSLQYYFRTEDITTQVDSILRGINVIVNTATSLEQTVATGIPPTGVLNFEIQG